MASLVYIDHNVYNLMVRGKEEDVRQQYEQAGLTLVYSDENISEIERSSKRRESFYDLLERLEAKYIFVPLDVIFNHQGVLSVVEKSPRVRAKELAEARAGTESVSDGLDFLSKGYGGVEGKTFKEIVNAQLSEAEEHLNEVLDGTDENDPELSDVIARAKNSLRELEDARSTMEDSFVELDERANKGPVFDQLQAELGVRTVELNNIDPPGAVDTIWNMVGHKFGAPDLNIVDFLDKVKSFTEKGPDTQPRAINLVNGIYNWLNMIGYYRDDNLSDSARMKASFGDITHAGYGAACSMFLCNDKRMRNKIIATYSYLGVDCKILKYGGSATNVDA